VKLLIIVSLPLIILIFYLNVVNHFNYTPDDSYIYAQFAKNIVNGNGFAFNAGEPTYGITSPLWTMIISISGVFGTDFILSAKVIDVLFASLAILVFFLFANQVLNNYLVALLATLAFSMNAWFIRWSATGMETSLAVLLLLLTFYYCYKNEYLISFFFAALLYLTRPETIILPGLILIDIYLSSIHKKLVFKKIVVSSFLFLIIVLPWFVYAKLNFGTFIPNTALAKAAFGLRIDDFLWTVTDLFKTLLVTESVTLAIVMVGIFLMLYLIFRRQNPPYVKKAAIEWLIGHFVPLFWLIGFVLLYICTQANIISRYLLLIIPVIIIYSYSFLISILEQLKKSKYFYTAILALTIIIVLQNQVIFKNYVKPSINSFTSGMSDCFIPIGSWLKQNTPEDAVVFTPDIGAIGFYSDRKICDGAGLVSPEILEFIRQGFNYQNIMDQKLYRKVCDADYVIHRANKPDVLGDDNLRTIFFKTVYGLGLSNMETVYYTLYEVNKIKRE
jgi:hypothetical protein